MSVAKPAKVLVVSAWEPELTKFRELARGLNPDSSPSSHPTFETATVGIGLVDATLGISRLLEARKTAAGEHDITHVICLGTGGALPGSGLKIGDVAIGKNVRVLDQAIIEKRASVIGPIGETIVLDELMQNAFIEEGAKAASIANTLGVTDDDDLAKRLGEFGEVEHLEGYAVARACVVARIRCAIVLSIANTVGSSGRAEWRAHHIEASKQAGELAFRAATKLIAISNA